MKITLEHTGGQELEVILRGDTNGAEARQVLGAGYLCGYADSLLPLLKNMLPPFLIIYVVVYLVIFFSSKANEKEINESLSRN